MHVVATVYIVARKSLSDTTSNSTHSTALVGLIHLVSLFFAMIRTETVRKLLEKFDIVSVGFRFVSFRFVSFRFLPFVSCCFVPRQEPNLQQPRRHGGN